MNATSPIGEVTFPPYTLTGGVAYREFTDEEFREYVDGLQVGDRVIETTRCAFHLRQGTVYISGSGYKCVKWDAAPGETGQMGTAVTHGTRRVSDALPADPATYALLQAAWLSHFHVGVGSRVRVVRKAASAELGWENVWAPEMDGDVGETFEVVEIDETFGLLLVCGLSKVGAYFPFHVLAPVEEQPKVEVIELTEETRGDVPKDARYLVESPPTIGEIEPPFCEVNERWEENIFAGLTCKHTSRLRHARAATLAEIEAFKARHPHPPAVPEGQGEVTLENYIPWVRGKGSSFYMEDQPTAAVEIARHLDSCALNAERLNIADRVVACLNACQGVETEDLHRGMIVRSKPTPTPSAGQTAVDFRPVPINVDRPEVEAFLRGEVERLTEEVDEARTFRSSQVERVAKADCYDRICDSLGVKNDCLGAIITLTAENEHTRDAIRLVIGMWNNRPWYEVSTGDVDSYCNEIKRLKALRPAAKDDEGGGE